MNDQSIEAVHKDRTVTIAEKLDADSARKIERTLNTYSGARNAPLRYRIKQTLINCILPLPTLLVFWEAHALGYVFIIVVSLLVVMGFVYMVWKTIKRKIIQQKLNRYMRLRDRVRDKSYREINGVWFESDKPESTK